MVTPWPLCPRERTHPASNSGGRVDPRADLGDLEKRTCLLRPAGIRKPDCPCSNARCSSQEKRIFERFLHTCHHYLFVHCHHCDSSYAAIITNCSYSVIIATCLYAVIIAPCSYTVILTTCLYTVIIDRDSSVGIATRYGLDVPGIETRWGRDFPHPSRPALGPTHPPVQLVPGFSRG